VGLNSSRRTDRRSRRPSSETWTPDLGSKPNAHVSPYDAAFPGTLPVSNQPDTFSCSKRVTSSILSGSILRVSTSPSELPLHSNQTSNSARRLTGNIISTRTFLRGIRLPSTTVGTRPWPYSMSASQPFCIRSHSAGRTRAPSSEQCLCSYPTDPTRTGIAAFDFNFGV